MRREIASAYDVSILVTVRVGSIRADILKAALASLRDGKAAINCELARSALDQAIAVNGDQAANLTDLFVSLAPNCAESPGEGPAGLGLAGMGAKIAVSGFEGDKAHAWAESLRSQGYDAYANIFNVLSSSETQTMVDDVVNHFGRIDILVNSVGVNREQKADDVCGDDG